MVHLKIKEQHDNRQPTTTKQHKKRRENNAKAKESQIEGKIAKANKCMFIAFSLSCHSLQFTHLVSVRLSYSSIIAIAIYETFMMCEKARF